MGSKKRRTLFLGLSIIVLIVIVISVMTGFGPPNTHQVIPPELFNLQYAPEYLIEDIDYMLETMESVHPDLYYYTPRDTIARERLKLVDKLKTPMTVKEFYPLLAKFVAEFKDGHTSAIHPWEEWDAYLENGNRIFPFELVKRGGKILVESSYLRDSEIQPGDEIVKINGKSLDSLMTIFISEQSGEKLSYREASVLKHFDRYLWLHGIVSPFHITYLSSNTNNFQDITVSGVFYSDKLKEQESSISTSNRKYSFQFLDSGIGYLNFRSMKNLEDFKSFLEDVFTRIQHHPTSGLIIDLRKNGGGSTKLGEELLSYITNKPYRFNSRVEWKLSPQVKEYIKGHLPVWIRWLPLHLLHPMGRKIMNTPDGKFIVWDFEPAPPRENPLRFQGPVCVLIGPHTFSSAVKLADAIKTFSIATLIGEETGGNPNAFGDIFLFDLPHTHLQISVSTKRFIRANGNEEQKGGVFPDIEIIPDRAALNTGRDTVLDFAIKWVLQQAERQ
ncbi:MAG: hypothetical protein D6748_13995 [Calditrichaeota bacterium]|nr:MAG: hypothetical protein D6748_13995 [Calditrichota bacterium]